MEKCPVCHKEFIDKAELKHKTIFLCLRDGLYELEKGLLKPMKYPCPKCGVYYLPYKHEDGYAYMCCPADGVFRTSIRVSFNFRKFCSKIASKPNRDPSYYTPGENKIRKLLIDKGLKEGKDFHHNYKFEIVANNRKRHYWVDFYLKDYGVVLEYSPSIWHRMWNREKSDRMKYKLLSDMGI
ncbi:MAG: hypothetical protein ACTSPB_25480, partial [Candidatus Thorarchaeota archaeon]